MVKISHTHHVTRTGIVKRNPSKKARHSYYPRKTFYMAADDFWFDSDVSDRRFYIEQYEQSNGELDNETRKEYRKIDTQFESLDSGFVNFIMTEFEHDIIEAEKERKEKWKEEHR